MPPLCNRGESQQAGGHAAAPAAGFAEDKLSKVHEPKPCPIEKQSNRTPGNEQPKVMVVDSHSDDLFTEQLQIGAKGGVAQVREKVPRFWVPLMPNKVVRRSFWSPCDQGRLAGRARACWSTWSITVLYFRGESDGRCVVACGEEPLLCGERAWVFSRPTRALSNLQPRRHFSSRYDTPHPRQAW